MQGQVTDLDLPGRWVDWEKEGWEEAGRPAPETYTPALVRYDDDQGTSGWNLCLTR